MARSRPLRQRPPLDSKRVEELAIRYVGRYATTRAKLTAYLARKVRERGWIDEREPNFDALADRFCELGYVDDADGVTDLAAYAVRPGAALRTDIFLDD